MGRWSDQWWLVLAPPRGWRQTSASWDSSTSRAVFSVPAHGFQPYVQGVSQKSWNIFFSRAFSFTARPGSVCSSIGSASIADLVHLCFVITSRRAMASLYVWDCTAMLCGQVYKIVVGDWTRPDMDGIRGSGFRPFKWLSCCCSVGHVR
jgi:hypothetical protein